MDRNPAEDRTAWEATSLGDLRQSLAFEDVGLSEDEARRRLARDGANVLPQARSPSIMEVFGRQFMSPLIAILGVAAVFAAAIGEWVDAGFVAAVLLLNAVIGTIQEGRAERSAQALQKMLKVTSMVERGGHTRGIDAAGLVVGDIVHLESGQVVPADLRLLRAHAMEVDESLLTGESAAVSKDAAWVADGPLEAADRKNMVHAGTMLVRGRATGVVVATGMGTEIGRIARDIGSAPTPPPLIVRMKRFARVVGFVTLLAATALVGLGVATGNPLREMVLFAVAAAVSAVPEGLPVALTVALAIGTTRMARRRVVVRRLAAVEGLGSCTVIATDKTGTLTMNALTVREARVDGDVFAVTGEGFVPIGEVLLRDEHAMASDHAGLARLTQAVALCNEAELFEIDDEPRWAWQGDPTDVALLALALKAGVRAPVEEARAPLVAEIPFEPERRYAATFHGGAEPRVFVKGAPERVVPMCTGVDAQETLGEAEQMARQGLRVLAVATAPSSLAPGETPTEPSDLEFLGLVGMMNPPRPGVVQAIDQAKAAGIKVVMVTGDHPTTAKAIAQAVHIPVPDAGLMTGAELEALPASEIATRLQDVTVFARVAPHQKLQVVEALQANGHFVAVTGDGVNDAPALRIAHVGVAMGQAGTDVARAAADIVLTDDQFPSVIAGIEEGRVAYSNVRNVVFLLVSTGAAEILLLFLALGTGSPVPLLPAQILWLNLVTNGIQDVALGAEPGRGDELQQAPRDPKERIFNRIMIERTLLTALVMGGGGFLAFRWMIGQGWEVDAARNGLLLLMVLFENVHVGNSRSETHSAFRLSPFRNPFLLWGVVAAQAIHIASMYIPFMRRVLRTEPVAPEFWLALFGVSLCITVFFELHKWLRRRWPVDRQRTALRHP